MSQKFLIAACILFIITLLGGSMKDAEKFTTLFFEPTIQPKTVQPTITTPPSQALGTTSPETYLVTKVIDGDTIEIQSGQKIRYIGIDTPELKGNECFAKEAKEQNKLLVEGKYVKLQKDVSETDKYGRLLRYVYTEDNTFVNNLLVQKGFATVSTYPPDVAYQELFKASQQEAMQMNRGLWQAKCK